MTSSNPVSYKITDLQSKEFFKVDYKYFKNFELMTIGLEKTVRMFTCTNLKDKKKNEKN